MLRVLIIVPIYELRCESLSPNIRRMKSSVSRASIQRKKMHAMHGGESLFELCFRRTFLVRSREYSLRFFRPLFVPRASHFSTSVNIVQRHPVFFVEKGRDQFREECHSRCALFLSLTRLLRCDLFPYVSQGFKQSFYAKK